MSPIRGRRSALRGVVPNLEATPGRGGRRADPEILLRRIVEQCGAETGFVVVREDGSYQQKLEVGEERGRRSDLECRFSRTL